MNREKNKKSFLSEKSKTIWKVLILIFIINIVILNWKDIYWIFNPKVSYQGIQSLISQDSFEDSEKIPYSDKENGIEIPKIGIVAPIVETGGTSDKEFAAALDKGVVHFPESVSPGEKGVSILLGHSAPPGWPKIKYDWVFSDLEKLEQGDEIIIHYQKRKYVFKVTDKIFLEIGEDVPTYTSENPEIILLSCWPPGRNIKRIGVRGVLSVE